MPEDWAKDIGHFIDTWDDNRGLNPVVHKDNFVRFVVAKPAESWESLQHWLNQCSDTGSWIFRGQADARWTLETSLERATQRTIRLPSSTGIEPFVTRVNQTSSEEDLLFEFQRRAHHYLDRTPAEDEIVDWLALMQHFGAPTRLLDWTRSPYVALYFALERATPDVTHAVWAIESTWLSECGAKKMRAADSDYPVDENLRSKSRYVSRVMFREQNPPVIVSADPIRINERMAAQQGLFLCNLNRIEEFDITLLRMMVDSRPASPVVKKLEIAPSCRSPFLRELSRMNITHASLFPGLEGFSHSLGIGLEISLDRVLNTLESPMRNVADVQGRADSHRES